MQLAYEITSFPDQTAGYHLTAYTEGRLRLLIGEEIFLDANGILLVEFAIVLRRWLVAMQHSPSDFYYASMDFEEEPILALKYASSLDSFIPESVWAKPSSKSVPATEAVEGGQAYIACLRQELMKDHAVDLEKILKATV